MELYFYLVCFLRKFLVFPTYQRTLCGLYLHRFLACIARASSRLLQPCKCCGITGRLKSERETHSKRIADLTTVVHVAKVEVHVVRVAIAALRTRLIEGQRAKSLVYNLLALIHFYFRFLSLSLLRKIKHINSL